VASAEADQQIAPRMRSIRGADLQQCRLVYRDGRIVDQLNWYASGARRNGSRVVRLRLATLQEPAGVAIGIVTRDVRFDALGIFAAARCGRHRMAPGETA